MTDKKPSEVLSAAHKVIQDPDRWTQGAWARDVAGQPTDPRAAGACRWCAIGAVYEATPNPTMGVVAYLVRAASMEGRTPASLNDQCGHDAVVDMYERAIEMAQEDER